MNRRIKNKLQKLENKFIEEIALSKVVRLKRGDTLVFETSKRLDSEGVNRIQNSIGRIFGDKLKDKDVKIMVLEEGDNISVYR